MSGPNITRRMAVHVAYFNSHGERVAVIQQDGTAFLFVEGAGGDLVTVEVPLWIADALTVPLRFEDVAP